MRVFCLLSPLSGWWSSNIYQFLRPIPSSEATATPIPGEGRHNPPLGQIIGGVGGCLCLLVLGIIIIILRQRRHRKATAIQDGSTAISQIDQGPTTSRADHSGLIIPYPTALTSIGIFHTLVLDLPCLHVWWSSQGLFRKCKAKDPSLRMSSCPLDLRNYPHLHSLMTGKSRINSTHKPSFGICCVDWSEIRWIYLHETSTRHHP